ncbi:MAG: WGR domain-containing protein [Myxococcales bacterium]|nr:WGR domain-containing protein [Myxococcales bacterium]
MARYEFQDGKSHKFWEIEQQGNTFTVRYGRVGTDGQSNTKVFDSEAQARAEADKMIRSKTKKGYQPVAAVAAAPDPSENPELEAAVAANPDDADTWLVYADWLQGVGEPRGELIAAQARGESYSALLDTHSKAFLGRFATDLKPYVQLTWAFGFWRTARAFCDYESAEAMPDGVAGIASVVGHLLRHPSAQFLRELRIGLTEGFMDGEADWQDAIDAVVKNGIRNSIRRLFVGDFERVDDTEISWTHIGSLKGIWTVLPNLEHLTVQGGGIKLGAIDAPHLKRLELWTGGLPTEPVLQLGKAQLPALEDLEIWLGTENYGGECSADDLEGILTGSGLPAVKRLGLMNGDFANDLPRALVNAPILKQLEVLDLSMGTMTDEGAAVIADNAAAFAHLRQLNLGDNFIGNAVRDRIRGALPNAHVGGQEDANDWVYVSVGE